MDEQGYRFGVGVLVVASLVIAVILILFFGAAPNFFSEKYNVTIRFDEAPGVATDTPVRKNGVQIGRVKSVQLLDEDGVDLTLELDAKVKIRAGEQPRISQGSLITGDAIVEFIQPTQESLLTRFDGTGGSPRDLILDENEVQMYSATLENGDFLTGGRVAPDPFDALLNMQAGLGTTLSAIETAGNQVTALATDVRRLLGSGDGEMQRITQQAERTIENFNQTLDSIETLFNDPNLKATLDTVATRLPDLVNEAEAVMQQTNDTLAAFEGVGRAAEETVRSVTELTEPLGRQGEKLVSDAVRTLNNLDALLLELRQVAGRVNSSQGTVAKLLDDDQLYYTFINTLENVETLTRRLQPIVEDARIFTDKVARQPSSIIDIRGALTGRPTNAGVK
ncbi:MAG: MCE family protein [Planctomycetales bacterium]|nr:MCE family protein [Planctomycetales bacterium]